MIEEKHRAGIALGLRRLVDNSPGTNPTTREKQFAAVLRAIELAFSNNEGHAFAHLAVAMQAAAESTPERLWVPGYRVAADAAEELSTLGERDGDVSYLQPDRDRDDM